MAYRLPKQGVVGFIVLVNEAGVTERIHEPIIEGDAKWPKAGLLLEGGSATLFSSNHAAQNAIDRTMEYRTAMSLIDWPDRDSYRIVPVLGVV